MFSFLNRINDVVVRSAREERFLTAAVTVSLQVFGIFWNRDLYRRFTTDYKDTNAPSDSAWTDSHTTQTHTQTHLFSQQERDL